MQGSTKKESRLHSYGPDKRRPSSRRERANGRVMGQPQLPLMGQTNHFTCSVHLKKLNKLNEQNGKLKYMQGWPVCSKALAVDRLPRNDKLTNLSQRGIGVTRRPPGAVGYSTNSLLRMAALQSHHSILNRSTKAAPRATGRTDETRI